VLVLRPSSPIRAARVAHTATARPAESKAVETKEPFIDEGLPLPESYQVDVVRAMLQNPFRIFVYWEVREESLKAITRYFSPEDAAAFRLVLKLREERGGHESLFDAERKGRYWMSVFPDLDYQFEIGVHSPLHGYITLVRSNVVRTPPGTISPVTADDPEYHVTPSEMSRIMDASGFGADKALDITIAAASEAVGDNVLEKALERLPESVRLLLAAAAGKEAITIEMIERLPDPLRAELMKLLEGSGVDVASAGLMHYLPELLRQSLGDESEWVEDHLHPLHIAPRYFAGGSEQLTRPSEKLRLPTLPQFPGSFQMSDVEYQTSIAAQSSEY
jgi:hypothetical protein